ncbi:MAG: protein translocase subunit SecD [Acidiferrobacterales bacterium]
MNRYPAWKYILILLILIVGGMYAVPNVFGEDPAIQVTTNRTGTVSPTLLGDIEGLLKRKKIDFLRAVQDGNDIEVRFFDTETQLKARDIVQRELGQNYTVALNLLPATPSWLQSINAKPMYLGLDLRGGVHFLLQVDMTAVLKKAVQSYASDIRSAMRDKDLRYLSVRPMPNNTILAKFRSEADREKGHDIITNAMNDLVLKDQPPGDRTFDTVIQLNKEALEEKRRFAIDQNIESLRNRVNELGVAEPIIQQQGEDRIVVQLPGVQDTAKAKKILGRVATLEVKMVDEDYYSSGLGGPIPPGSRVYKMRHGGNIVVKNQLVYSGDNIVDAAPDFDPQSGGAIVRITLDSQGAAKNQRVTGENINKRMAVIYREDRVVDKLDINGKPVLDDKGNPVKVKKTTEEVITAPVIKTQLGKRFQIEGLDSVEEADELALLLRAGALAAPVQIIEERTIGPSLGKDNVAQGMKSIQIGLAAVVIFMIVYYRVFGLIANIALLCNVVLIVAILSIVQATLTLPGIAGILLTVGMAVDANVLIFERIREELRNGNTPQASIAAGYEKAFGTIADSNITTLIAGVTLFNFGTGPIKGFAITLSIGILTSMFTAIMVTRAITNLGFGGRKLKSIPI